MAHSELQGNSAGGLSLTRRDFGRAALSALVCPGILSDDAARIPGAHLPRPLITDGVQAGRISNDRYVIWSRSDRPARMEVEWSTTESFADAQRVRGPLALPENDFTAKTLLEGLPPGQTIFYRVRFRDLDSAKELSNPCSGTLKVPARERSAAAFIWSGDTAGQGFGIDTDRGGMKLYQVMQEHHADLFIHSGDTIYADNPIPAEVPLPGGGIWRNTVTEEKSKVAETLGEFRGNYRYNLLDQHVQSFNRSIAQVVQWDDHETRNNWYPGQTVEDARYTERRCDVLSARARQAFVEYSPILPPAESPERIFETVSFGPDIDFFKLDARSYRGPNTANDQEREGPDTAFFGNEQLRWLKAALLRSTATWKIILNDMPLGLVVADGARAFEATSQGDGPPRGRELEVAGLLRFMKTAQLHNVVWLTADVHYAAAHYYDSAAARFTDFNPFWEFVAGPIHAGTYGLNKLDNTFGPRRVFASVPEDLPPATPPTAGLQFFGKVSLDKSSLALTVSLHNLRNEQLYSVEIDPVLRR